MAASTGLTVPQHGTNPLAHYEITDIAELADTPAITRPAKAFQNEQWENLRLQFEKRVYGLRTWRVSWWEHWAVLANNILPRRYHFLITPNSTSRGLAINGQIANPAATQAVRVCTSGMKSGLMSSSRPWFKLKPSLNTFEPDQAALAWFDEVESRIYAVLNSSNFYDAATQMFEDLIVFGTAPMIVYEDKKDIIRCYNPCAGEYYLGAGSDFRVNSFYRTFVLTVFQCVQMFGLENVGPEVQGLWENKGSSLETEVVVAHVIEPNFPLNMPGMPGDKAGVVPGGFPFREYYWLYGRSTPGPCSVKGFREQPFIAPRWATTSNDAYGRSPAMDALPDILQLQVMTRRDAEAIEKMVRPPMAADTGLKNQPSSILPGRVTYMSDISKGMKPIYEVKPDIAAMDNKMMNIENRIKTWFFNDLFLMLAEMEGVQPRQDLEIIERRGEKLQQLGPVVEKFENEGARIAIKRVAAILERRGLLPPKPRSLQGIPLEIEFISMLSLAQRAATTAVMERGLRMAGTMQGMFPDQPPLDNINPDEFLHEYLERSAFPVKTLFGENDVQKTRQSRLQALQKAQQQQQSQTALTHTVPAMAGAAKDASAAAATSSDIDTGGGLNAIQMLLGQGGAAPGATGLPQ